MNKRMREQREEGGRSMMKKGWLNGRNGWRYRRCTQRGGDLYSREWESLEWVIVLSTCVIAMRRMDRRHRHTNTRGDMRTLVATAVNRQKPKMVENEGPITLLLPPPSQSDYATSPTGVMHTYTHTQIPDHALPPNQPLYWWGHWPRSHITVTEGEMEKEEEEKKEYLENQKQRRNLLL